MTADGECIPKKFLTALTTGSTICALTHEPIPASALVIPPSIARIAEAPALRSPPAMFCTALTSQARARDATDRIVLTPLVTAPTSRRTAPVTMLRIVCHVAMLFDET